MRTMRSLHTFQYFAVDEGSVARGLIRAETESAALAQLLRKGYSRARVRKRAAPLTTRLPGG